MSSIPSTFRAYVAEKVDGGVDRGVRSFAAADLPPGNIEVKVDWSSVNYKDALATIREHHAALGRHLGASIATAYFCTYSVPPEDLVSWIL